MFNTFGVYDRSLVGQTNQNYETPQEKEARKAKTKEQLADERQKEVQSTNFGTKDAQTNSPQVHPAERPELVTRCCVIS